MEFLGWPRHQLRAQGRKDRRPPQTHPLFSSGEISAASPKKDSISRTTQLLDFLSNAAAQSERAILKPTAVPEFARVQSFMSNASDIHAHIAAKREQRRNVISHDVSALRANLKHEEQAEKFNPASLLGRLADTLKEEAITVDIETPQDAGEADTTDFISEPTAWSENRVSVAAAELAYGADYFESDMTNDEGYAWLEGDFVDDDEVDESAVILLERAYVSDLDQWFGSRSDDDDDADGHAAQPFDDGGEDDGDGSVEGSDRNKVHAARRVTNERIGSGLPRVLPPVLFNPYGFTGYDDLYPPAEPKADCSQVSRSKETEAALQKKYSRSLYTKTPADKPDITTLQNGTRLEKFSDGAVLAKDAHGRVTEVSTPDGFISVLYDPDGKPETFVRCDSKGRAHSLGERDRHGVVVRDPEGRVRAAGESMAVDPNGCLSVRRFDGQFWSLDLIRGMHIERRRLYDKEGSLHSLTAVFASDGFRMMTRFQPLEQSDASASFKEASGKFRFYGRDGSVVQFECEDELVDLRPSQVWPPASRHVEPVWRGHLQGGTAWQSVQEYVTNYLLA